MAPLPEFPPPAGQVESQGGHCRTSQQEDQAVEKGEGLDGLEGLLGGRPPPQVNQADRLGVNRPGKVSARLLEQGETPDVLNGLAGGAAAADAHYTQRMTRRYVR
jgi:hypothetical protein